MSDSCRPERGVASIVDASPDGENLIYGNGSNVIVRSISDPAAFMVYGEHTAQVKVAKFSPSGNYIASGDVNGTVRVWAFNNPEHNLKAEVRCFNGEIEDLAWGPENKRIVAVGAGQATAKVFMWDTGSSLGEIMPLEKKALTCAMKPNRPYRMVFGGEDFSAALYSGPPFRFACSLTEHTNFVNCIRYSPSGDVFVSVSSDRQAIIYDGATGEVQGKLNEADQHKGSIYHCSFSKDGTKLVTSGADKTLKVWDVASRDCIKTITIGSTVNEMQNSVVWAGNTIVSLSLDGTLNYIDAESLEVVKHVAGHRDAAAAIAWDASTSGIASVCQGGRMVKWAAGETPTSFVASLVKGEAHTKRAVGVAAASGRIASIGWDDHVRVADAATGEFIFKLALGAQPKGVAVSPVNGSLQFVVTGSAIKVVSDGAVAHEVEAAYTPTCVAISNAGDLLVVGGKDKKTYFYKVGADGALTADGSSDATTAAVSSVSITPDGQLVAVGDALREIRLYNTGDKACVKRDRWRSHTTRVSRVAWSPSGHLLASVSSDRRICFWAADNNDAVRTIELAHFDSIVDVIWQGTDMIWTLDNSGVMKSWSV